MMTKSLIESIFGVYTPITTSTLDAAGNTVTVVASGMAGVDWQYILGVALFALTLYMVLSIVRSVISRV